MTRLLDELREDLSWFNLVGGRPVPVRYGWLRTLIKAWMQRGSKAVLLYRVAYRLRCRGWRGFAAVLSNFAFRTCHSEISSSARIAGGLRLPHPQGVIIGAFVKIDRMVTVGQHVTLGGNLGKRDETGRFMPRIGENVIICAGSVVGGPVDVGPNTVIGANSVVTRSLPGNVVAAGAPAHVLRQRQSEEADAVADS